MRRSLRTALLGLTIIISFNGCAALASLTSPIAAALEFIQRQYHGTDKLVANIEHTCDAIARRCASIKDGVCAPLQSCGFIYLEVNKVLAGIELGVVRIKAASGIQEYERAHQITQEVGQMFNNLKHLISIFQGFKVHADEFLQGKRLEPKPPPSAKPEKKTWSA